MDKTVATCKDPTKKPRKAKSITNAKSDGVGETISNVFMIANGYYYKNGMWFAHDNTENKVYSTVDNIKKNVLGEVGRRP